MRVYLCCMRVYLCCACVCVFTCEPEFLTPCPPQSLSPDLIALLQARTTSLALSLQSLQVNLRQLRCVGASEVQEKIVSFKAVVVSKVCLCDVFVISV